jgi:hypothetical protein
MTWIKTVPMAEASEGLRRAVEAQRALYPIEYATPVHPSDDTSAIVAYTASFPRHSTTRLPHWVQCCRPNYLSAGANMR